MAAMIVKLTALLSLVLMPLGMSTAAAEQPRAHHMASTDAGSHCGGEDAPAAPMHAECLACAGLPVAFASAPADRLLPRTPRTLVLAGKFRGIEPELATPPPRA